VGPAAGNAGLMVVDSNSSGTLQLLDHFTATAVTLVELHAVVFTAVVSC
jgi:hypothetical protein